MKKNLLKLLLDRNLITSQGYKEVKNFQLKEIVVKNK